ncbi:MAG: tyrosine-type recombinase/integrase [Syntrophothermus sp.]
MKKCNYIESFIQRFAAYEKYPGSSLKTQKEYSVNLYNFKKWFEYKYNESLNKNTYTTIDRNVLEAFLMDLGDIDVLKSLYGLKAKINSNRTKVKKISMLKMFFEYLVYERVILINPAREIDCKKLKFDKKNPEYYTKDEFKMLLNNVKQDCNYKRNITMLKLFFYTGMREEELANINRPVNLKFEDSFNIIGKGYKERTVFLTPEVQKELNEYMESTNNYGYAEPLFISTHGKRLSLSSIKTIITDIQKLAGFEHKTGVHKLRHSFATEMIKKAPIDIVSMLLGHVNINTTTIYAHRDNEQLQNSVLTVFDN